MSDSKLTVIPAEPLLLLPMERLEAARALLCTLRSPQAVEIGTSDTPVFHDACENFCSVTCPFCRADLMEQWSDLIAAWWDGDHRVLDMVTPCCGRPTTLNDLDYDWPQGFACCSIELLNAGLALEPDEHARVEAVLGTPIRVIQAYF